MTIQTLYYLFWFMSVGSYFAFVYLIVRIRKLEDTIYDLRIKNCDFEEYLRSQKKRDDKNE